jgi:hypothetical protein
VAGAAVAGAAVAGAAVAGAAVAGAAVAGLAVAAGAAQPETMSTVTNAAMINLFKLACLNIFFSPFRQIMIGTIENSEKILSGITSLSKI